MGKPERPLHFLWVRNRTHLVANAHHWRRCSLYNLLQSNAISPNLMWEFSLSTIAEIPTLLWYSTRLMCAFPLHVLRLKSQPLSCTVVFKNFILNSGLCISMRRKYLCYLVKGREQSLKSFNKGNSIENVLMHRIYRKDPFFIVLFSGCINAIRSGQFSYTSHTMLATYICKIWSADTSLSRNNNPAALCKIRHIKKTLI